MAYSGVPRGGAWWRMSRVGVVLMVGGLVVSGCSAQSDDADEQEESATAAPVEYPVSHIHDMDVDAETGTVLLATHEGLVDVSTSPATSIGPTIDLMSFAVGADGTMYASGHPGPGVEMPNPVGLITSSDSGKTWSEASRAMESDFHALTVTDQQVIGFDGQLLTSPDDTTWQPAESPVEAYHLSSTDDAATVLATTEGGLQRSTDHGQTWDAVDEAPVLMLTAMVGDYAVGVAPDNTVYLSDDAGLTWQQRSTVEEDVSAIDITTSDDGLQLWVATDTQVQVSDDQGQTFTGIDTASADE